PMETVADNLPSGEKSTFDCVYVYEALHHAYSWEDTISSSFECLKPGGWLLICQEPNLIHTWVSYRISVLSNAHEIGMNRRSIIKHMRESGYRTVRILENRIGLGVRPIWLAAQK
ncbi:MAG: methyltransferase domain-containing protein, partial [Bacteroidota bacterium]